MDWSGVLPSAGYWGSRDRLAWPVEIEEDGLYTLQLMMANTLANLRVQLWVDGVLHQIVTLEEPTGDWNRYDLRDAGSLQLTAGKHVIEIASVSGQSSFMNLRYGLLRTGEVAPPAADESRIRLDAITMNTPKSGSPLRVEWLRDPMAIGYWEPGETARWKVTLEREHTYRPTLTYATPNTGTVFSLSLDGKDLVQTVMPVTKDWNRFETIPLDPITLPAGSHILTATWEGTNPDGCGNLSEMLLREQ